MKRLVAIFGVIVAITLSSCGGSDSADVGANYVNGMSQIAGALESVKDEGSAKTAAHEIGQVTVKLQSVVDEINSMSQAEQVMMVQKHAAKMAEVQGRISMALQKIVSQDPKLMDIIGSELRSMPQLR